MGRKKKKNMGVQVPPYTGWRPRSMRRGRKNLNQRRVGEADNRKAKRSRLGNAKQRFIYKSAKGYMHPDYGRLCDVADKLNGRKK